MRKHAFIIASMFIMSGCSTIVEGSSQSVHVSTPGVDGALCVLSSPEIGSVTVRTPGSAHLSKSKHDISVACEKECYTSGGGVITSDFQGMTFGNILIGGIIGAGVDAASGAMNKYQPSISIHMDKIDDC